MATKIFVNFPVRDLNQSIEFFTKLGYTFNPHHGFMYGHGYQDLDGHSWELMWMDPSAIK